MNLVELQRSLRQLRLARALQAARAPRDEIAAGIWRRLGLPIERIYYLPKADNWWGPAGATGPS